MSDTRPGTILAITPAFSTNIAVTRVLAMKNNGLSNMIGSETYSRCNGSLGRREKTLRHFSRDKVINFLKIMFH